MKQSQNIEIERKYISLFELKEDDVPETQVYKTSISHDRYFTAPSGLIRLRDDEEKGFELTAKTYKKDNLHRREINLNLNNGNSLKDCLEFAEVAGWTMRLEFKQQLKIWITDTACVSQTIITDLNDQPYRYSRELNFITNHPGYPIARFVEIEIIDTENSKAAFKEITRIQKSLGLSNNDKVGYSLIQLFGAYPL